MAQTPRHVLFLPLQLLLLGLLLLSHADAFTSKKPAAPCGIGVDMVDLLWRRWPPGADPSAVNDTRSMMKLAVENGFTYARVGGAPFWPSEYPSSSEQWAQLWEVWAGIFADAETAGLSLGVSIIWNFWAPVDLCHEHLSALIPPAASPASAGGTVLSSCSRQFVKNYTSSFLSRFGSSKALGYVELTNELNLAVDIDQNNRTSGCAPQYGTPVHRTSADNISTTDMVAFTAAWVGWIRASAPDVMISSGFSAPRPSAFHLMQSYYKPHRDWTLDTKEQFASMYRLINQHVDLASLHVYQGVNGNQRWGTADPYDMEILAVAKQALQGTNQVPYFGEYGEERGTSANRTYTKAALAGIVANDIKASTLWVWMMQGQSTTFSIYPSKDPGLIDAMKAANKGRVCS